MITNYKLLCLHIPYVVCDAYILYLHKYYYRILQNRNKNRQQTHRQQTTFSQVHIAFTLILPILHHRMFVCVAIVAAAAATASNISAMYN